MERKRSNAGSVTMFVMMVALVSQNLVIVSVIADNVKDGKNEFAPVAHAESSPSGLSSSLCNSLTLLSLLHFFI